MPPLMARTCRTARRRAAIARLPVLVLIVVIATIAGCRNGSGSDPSEDGGIAGVYELDRTAMQDAVRKRYGDSNDKLGQQLLPQIISAIDKMVMDVTLETDGTASVVMDIRGDAGTATGTWSEENGMLTILAAKEGQTPVPAVGRFDGNGFTLAREQNEHLPFDYIFIRKAN